MTSNNKVKAPRPCTLSKEWEGTGLIDSNNGYTLKVSLIPFDGASIEFVSGYISYTKNIDCNHPSEVDGEITQAELEVALAIASSQRPWLKEEGFEFVEGERYEVLHMHGGELMHDLGEFGNYGGVQGIGSSTFAEIGYIKAFKPVVPYDPTDTPEQRHAKEQAAWDAVAGVEALEG
jgi:hypothetical protein